MKPHAIHTVLLLLPLVLGILPSTPAATEPDGLSDLTPFAGVVVVDNGRKMPLDTFARIRLLQFAGKTTYNRQPAISWLARVFFTPEQAANDKIFLINHPQVVEGLNLQPDAHRRYSLRELEPASAKLNELARMAAGMDEKERTVVENELLRVAHNVNTYRTLSDGFLFASDSTDLHVHDPALQAALGVTVERHAIRLTALMQQADKVQTMLDSDNAAAIRGLTREAGRLFRRYQGRPPAIIPTPRSGTETWLSPWDALASSMQDPSLLPMLINLEDAAEAYRRGDQLQFDTAVRTFNSAVLARAIPDRQLRHIQQELRYNSMDLFYRSELLYGLAFLLGLTALVSSSGKIRLASLIFLILALVPQTAGILMRMSIMGRPPVTNLYSTFLFVGWMSAVLCLGLELAQKNALGSLAGGFSGLALLLLSRRFVSLSDPMGVLVAVLDSNFWLATHVVTISMGYAGCCLAGVVGHFYLLRAIVKPRDRAGLRSLYNGLFAVLGFGFTFSFLGTMLGGVWADQSWGRFWGWDPKENGALLIVLWCAILYHARVAHMIRDVGMAAGSIIGILVVLVAWVGVNLLGVGLHSYGFTSGVAGGLLLYAVIQMTLLVLLVIFAKRRLASVPPADETLPA